MQVRINEATQFAKDIKDNGKRSFTYPAEKHQGKLFLWIRCGDARIDDTRRIFRKSCANIGTVGQVPQDTDYAVEICMGVMGGEGGREVFSEEKLLLVWGRRGD